MSALARVPVDPDLERAIRELTPVALRLRMIEDDLIAVGADREFARYHHKIVMRDDASRAIAGRAEQLNLKPGSLRLMIEEWERLRRQSGRRPTLAQLQRAVIAANAIRQGDRLTRLSEQAVAQFRAKRATIDAADAEAGVKYLEACRD